MFLILKLFDILYSTNVLEIIIIDVAQFIYYITIMNIHRCKSKIHTDLSCHCLVVSHVSADSFEPKLQCFGLISSIETKFSQTLKSTFDIEIVQKKIEVRNSVIRYIKI